MSMLTNLRKNIASLIFKNQMSLPQEFMRYGNKTIRSDWTEVLMNDKDHYTGYSYASIRNRANIVSKLAMENIVVEGAETHPYLDLIWNSTSFTEYQFWHDISTYLDLEGVYYLMAVRAVSENRVGNVQAFKLLNPYYIRRVLTPDKLQVAGYLESKKGMVREIPKEMIIEIRELNPFDEDTPYAMTDASKESQFTLKTASDYTRHAIRGNINAPGILSTDIILPDQDFANFASRVKNHSKGEPIFGNGSGAIKWEPMTQNLRDSALEIVNEVNRDQLFAVTGVSKTIMGIEQSGTTRETARVQKDLVIEGQAIPRVQMILDALNLDYARYYGDRKIYLIVNNPNATDFDANTKETTWKKSQFELYDMLISKGYDATLASEYISGKITIDQLGKPTEKKEIVEEQEIKTENPEEYVKNQMQSVILRQQGGLQNAIVNIEGKVTAKVIERLRKKYSKTAVNAIEDADEITEADLISKYDKKDFSNELALIIATFYGIIFTLQGEKAMKERVKETGMTGDFTLDKEMRAYLKNIADKASKGHVDTISKDLYELVRKDALSGKSLDEVISNIKREYSQEITEQRAKTIARTETNRAFSRSQYEADRQFIKQNNLEGRVYKKWVTRSANPCEFCQSLARQAPIPFNQAFGNVGDSIKADGKEFSIGFENVEAGTLHPNCACIYEIIIEPAKNYLEKQQAEIEKEKEKIKVSKEELEKLQKEISEIIKI